MKRTLAILLFSGLMLAVITTAGISKLEEHDSFCTSCHTLPEAAYHERAIAALAVSDPFELADLASYHYWQASDFRCIDCHRGDDSPGHRATVLGLAARDTVTWLTGRANPTIEKGSIPNLNPNQATWQGPDRYNREPDILNAGCLKCHQDTLTLVGFENHFHNKLPAARLAYAQTGQLNYPEGWAQGVGSSDLLQAEDTVLTCLDCHRVHVQGFESEFFLDQNAVALPACVQCHLETGRGPRNLIP